MAQGEGRSWSFQECPLCCFSLGKRLRASFLILPDPRAWVLQRKSLLLLKFFFVCLFFCEHSHCSKVLLVIFQHLLMSCLINNPAQSFQTLPTPPLAGNNTNSGLDSHLPESTFGQPTQHQGSSAITKCWRSDLGCFFPPCFKTRLKMLLAAHPAQILVRKQLLAPCSSSGIHFPPGKMHIETRNGLGGKGTGNPVFHPLPLQRHQKQLKNSLGVQRRTNTCT